MFVQKNQLIGDVWEFSFTPERPAEYVPGQYARFTFPFHLDDTHGEQHRTFSFISHPSEPNIRFITRLDAPLSAFKQPLSNLQPGDAMIIDEPHGDAILPRIETVPLIFVAQGIALASYIAMLQEIAGQKLKHPTTFLWAHRPADSPLARLIPADATIATMLEFTYPKKLTSAHIARYDTPGSLIYLSGGQNFVESLGAEMEANGTPRERIIYDYYEGYSEL